MPGIPGKLELSPEQNEDSGAFGKLSAAITDAGSKADDVLGRVQVVENAAKAFRPGTTAEARLAGQKALMDGLSVIGITPPDWLRRGVASGETLDKEGGYLAAEMTRQLGSREAASVFNQIRSIQPGLKLSEGGLEAITGSIKQGALRDKDLLNFRDQWIADPSHGGSIRGMQQAFDQTHPTEAYASRVLPFPVPQDQAKLIPNVVYRNDKGALGIWDGRSFQPVN
jgi:hypothetical protein